MRSAMMQMATEAWASHFGGSVGLLTGSRARTVCSGSAVGSPACMILASVLLACQPGTKWVFFRVKLELAR